MISRKIVQLDLEAEKTLGSSCRILVKKLMARVYFFLCILKVIHRNRHNLQFS